MQYGDEVTYSKELNTSYHLLLCLQIKWLVVKTKRNTCATWAVIDETACHKTRIPEESGAVTKVLVSSNP